MCLAIPGMVEKINTIMDGTIRMAEVNFGGILKTVSLEMLPEAAVGDYVLVHVGFAIGKVDPDEAERVFSYLVEIGEVEELTAGEDGQ